MGYKRPLNDNKISGKKSILQLSFSSTFLILILGHLKVHPQTPLAFPHISTLLRNSCFLAHYPAQLWFGTTTAFSHSTAKINTKHLFCFSVTELLDEELGMQCVDMLFK